MEAIWLRFQSAMNVHELQNCKRMTVGTTSETGIDKTCSRDCHSRILRSQLRYDLGLQPQEPLDKLLGIQMTKMTWFLTDSSLIPPFRPFIVMHFSIIIPLIQPLIQFLEANDSVRRIVSSAGGWSNDSWGSHAVEMLCSHVATVPSTRQPCLIHGISPSEQGFQHWVQIGVLARLSTWAWRFDDVILWFCAGRPSSSGHSSPQECQ